MISYRKAEIADVIEILPKLRESDVIELLLSSGPEYGQALIDSIEMCHGEAESAIDAEGNVIAILGCCSVESNQNLGVPFMVCSDEVDKYPIQVVSDAKARTELWNNKHPVLVNMVYSKNETSIKWLQHIGYNLGELDENWGYASAPFYKFYKVKQNV
jgi:hypothetical protein